MGNGSNGERSGLLCVFGRRAAATAAASVNWLAAAAATFAANTLQLPGERTSEYCGQLKRVLQLAGEIVR